MARASANFRLKHLALPPVQPFRQRCRHEGGRSDHYGALHATAEYTGLAMPAQYVIRAVWQRDCFGLGRRARRALWLSAHPRLDVLAHDELPLAEEGRAKLKPSCVMRHRSWVAMSAIGSGC